MMCRRIFRRCVTEPGGIGEVGAVRFRSWEIERQKLSVSGKRTGAVRGRGSMSATRCSTDEICICTNGVNERSSVCWSARG